MTTLIVQTGPLDGTIVPIPIGQLIIGRALDCDLKLQDPRVSRHHCVLTFDGQHLGIRDLGSRSGTLVNNQPVGLCQSLLHHGDLFSIAGTVFRVSFDGI
jgi:pSer/pThr/pTyr-binding forkhead associated (FHA) protein